MSDNNKTEKPITGAHLKPQGHGAGCACCNPLADDEFDDDGEE